MRNCSGLTIVIITIIAASTSMSCSPSTASSKSSISQNSPAGKKSRGFGADLQAGLLATPGCLGVETAMTGSGKNLIFAWFKDKQSVLAWYKSETHTKAMHRFFPNRTPSDMPLADVPDDAGPLLVIAAMKLPQPGAKPDANAQPQPPEFSIDTLTPVTAGLTTSPTGSFAPADFRKLFEEHQAARAKK